MEKLLWEVTVVGQLGVLCSGDLWLLLSSVRLSVCPFVVSWIVWNCLSMFVYLRDKITNNGVTLFVGNTSDPGYLGGPVCPSQNSVHSRVH